MATDDRLPGPEAFVQRLPGIQGLAVAFAALTAEVVVVLLYLSSSSGTLEDPLTVVYPFVWMNAAAVAAWATTVPAATGRRRAVATAVAAGYLVVLGYFGGVLRPGYALVAGPSTPGWYVSTGLPPGYGPAAVYEGALATVVVVPYKLVGYATLAYLVYATVVDAAGAAVSGVLGLLSCVSCSWPILAAVASGLAGGGSALAAAAYDQSLWLSTLVFVVTVALLAWRPSFG